MRRMAVAAATVLALAVAGCGNKADDERRRRRGGELADSATCG